MADEAEVDMIICEGLTQEKDAIINEIEIELSNLVRGIGRTSRILCSGRTEDGQRKIRFSVRNPTGDIELVGNELTLLSAEKIFDLLCKKWGKR